MEKINIILDTDISNEIDDQFALCYVMKSLDRFNVEAITIAPFSKSGYAKADTVEEGSDLSFNTAKKILDMLGLQQYKNLLFMGARNYFWETKQQNDASNKIIEVCRKNQKTTIIAIGAITNVALAIEKAPDIIDKIEVVWLGGNSFLSEKNDEFNFRQDVDAVRVVFESKVKLVVIPCKNVASYLQTTIYEQQHYLKDSGAIGQYLCDIFKKCKKAYRNNKEDEIGEAKTLWDLSAIAYCINKNWFKETEVSCPEILEDTSYKQTSNRHKITFVNFMSRHQIFKDFFVKMGYKYD